MKDKAVFRDANTGEVIDAVDIGFKASDVSRGQMVGRKDDHEEMGDYDGGVGFKTNIRFKSETGRKDDHDKPMWSLLPMFIIERIVEVLNFGAKKYEPNNWQRVPKAENRYFSAAMRHLTAWQMGESTDKESGLSHLAHAACCLVFLMWFAERDAKRAKSLDEFKESISKESTNEA